MIVSVFVVTEFDYVPHINSHSIGSLLGFSTVDVTGGPGCAILFDYLRHRVRGL